MRRQELFLISARIEVVFDEDGFLLIDRDDNESVILNHEEAQNLNSFLNDLLKESDL